MEPPKPSSDNTTPKTNSDKERKQAFKKELCENLKKVSKRFVMKINIIVLTFIVTNYIYLSSNKHKFCF